MSMIFVILGSQKFQFNRLLMEIDRLIKDDIIKEEVFAQIGASEYIPGNYKYTNFLDADKFAELLNKADIIITHGGTGAIMGGVKSGKKVIVVPRLAKYGEHVDDHQIQILRQFDEMGIIKACYDVNELSEKYLQLESSEFKRYTSNTETIMQNIEKFLYE